MADESPQAAAHAAEAQPARRCGECHESYLTQWEGSAHALADRSPIYRAMRARAPEPAACDRCHAPLAAVLGRGELVAAEGVTCEVCHAIADVDLRPTTVEWSLQLTSNRKYGPLCGDVQTPYFHRTACSPLHEQSRLCAACHHRAHAATADEIPPVFSEFEEWQHGDAMTAGLHCQGCHMPDSLGQVASGGPLRGGVSAHDFMGSSGVALAASLRREADDLAVIAVVSSSGAAHALPVGLPGRQLVVRATAVDDTGASLGSAEEVFGRVLVDERGAEAPFFAAVRQAADTRLSIGEARMVVLRLPATAAAVELSLLERPLSPALARTLGLADPQPRILESRRLAVGEAAP
jgi:hypothetical protein